MQIGKTQVFKNKNICTTLYQVKIICNHIKNIPFHIWFIKKSVILTISPAKAIIFSPSLIFSRTTEPRLVNTINFTRFCACCPHTLLICRTCITKFSTKLPHKQGTIWEFWKRIRPLKACWVPMDDAHRIEWWMDCLFAVCLRRLPALLRRDIAITYNIEIKTNL